MKQKPNLLDLTRLIGFVSLLLLRHFIFKALHIHTENNFFITQNLISLQWAYHTVNPYHIIFSIESIFVYLKKYKRIKVVNLTKIFFSLFLKRYHWFPQSLYTKMNSSFCWLTADRLPTITLILQLEITVYKMLYIYTHSYL